MRTPNVRCFLCDKPLYRRPSELSRIRYAACMNCRGKAQSVAGITAKQREGLAKGSVKGTNHRTGYSHREESKAKASATHRVFWAENPEKAIERGAKCRGIAHYAWKGGVTRLNTSIRQMSENRRWMDAVKARDGGCTRCPSTERLESHHKKPLAELIESLGITSRDDARKYASVLWDLDNGITLCQDCHYLEHGRTKYAD